MLTLKKNILLYTPEEFSLLTNEELSSLVEVFWPTTRPTKTQINIAKNTAILKKAGIDLGKIVKVKPAGLLKLEKQFGAATAKLIYDEEQRLRKQQEGSK